MNIGRVWRKVAAKLREAGIDSADLDARLLVGHVLGLDTTGLIINERVEVGAAAEAEISALVARRLAGEPVARILGHQEFYGLDFALGADTLVPRPETEMLVDLALDHIRDMDHIREMDRPVLLDLGTGTGCIPIAILSENAHAQAVGVDLAAHALEVARANAQAHGVANRVQFAQSSWFDNVEGEKRFDLIVANPPYIVRDVMADLQREVRLYDPVLALDGGADGLDAYRQIITGAPGFLKRGGILMLEIGYDQYEAVALMCTQSGLHNVTRHADLAGHDRVVVAWY